eukprot:TRINITY_DN183_c0_g1_i4.p1 TRINITY_DN183_c0_g1~~TRINITY_DN183_c0_g1_i4.p1  ORF type:complete len:143 (-),score=16.58 TRINITY_DN183_c0_g1_i4:115-543(-)
MFYDLNDIPGLANTTIAEHSRRKESAYMHKAIADESLNTVDIRFGNFCQHNSRIIRRASENMILPMSDARITAFFHFEHSSMHTVYGIHFAIFFTDKRCDFNCHINGIGGVSNSNWTCFCLGNEMLAYLDLLLHVLPTPAHQ